MATHSDQSFGVSQGQDNSSSDQDILVIKSGPIFEQVESEAFRVYIYPFVVISLFMTVGLIGNSIVLYIFSFKWKSSKTTMFILTLAILDVFNCCWNMSIEVAILYNPLSFDYAILCKVSRFTTYVVSASYSFVLVSIGFDRYLMICRPFKSMTLGITYARRCCIAGVIFGMITQWPSLFFYGTFVFQIPIPTTGTNFSSIFVEGRTCLVNNYYLTNKLLPLSFQGFLFIGHIVIFVLLITVYIVIGRKLFLSSRIDVGAPQRKPSKMLRMSVMSAVTGVIPKGTLCSRGSKTTSVDNVQLAANAPLDSLQNGRGRRVSLEIKPKESERVCTKHGRKKCVCSLLYETRSLENVSTVARLENRTIDPKHLTQITGNVDRNSGSSYGSAATGSDRNSNPISSAAIENIDQPLISRSRSVDPRYKYSVSTDTNRLSTDIKEASLRQNTLIMRMVTFTFILSYFPFLVIVSVRYTNPDVPQNIDTVSKILYHVFLRSYFFNSVIRPFIYIVMDADYRRTFLRIVTCGRFGRK